MPEEIVNQVASVFHSQLNSFLFTLHNQNFSFYIIKRKAMGCGVVCGTIAVQTNNHTNSSKSTLNELLHQLNVNPPLLREDILNKFFTSLKGEDVLYILPVGQTVKSDEQIPQTIKQKWKILLYGLFKGDQSYKSCLGFSVRNQEQVPIVLEHTSSRNRVLENHSYHEVKVTTEYHTCFQQIQKDLNRTFEFKQETKALFQRVLKKISNHFPSMGYTQGVNFVVGFLLILGYSQSDTFWMFVHLAINRKYLVLGLYEDEFPLAVIYTILFKNLLKRYDLQLYRHLYQVIMLQDSVWIFKWFITYYIYSFPLQTIKFVWDIALELGGIGLVYYAVALVIKLKDQLLKINDSCDISEFLQSLKQLQNFNKYLKISQIIQFAYQIKLRRQDFEGINNVNESFYKQYFKLMSQGLTSYKKSCNDSTKDSYFISHQLQNNRLLHSWYEQLTQERSQFLKKSQDQRDKQMKVPSILKEEYQDLQKSIQLLQQKFVQNQSIRLTQKVIEQKPSSQIIENKSNLKAYQSPDKSIPYSAPKAKLATKPSYDISQQINQMQGQSDSNGEQLQVSLQYLQSRHDSTPSQELSIRILPEKMQGQNRQSGNLKINMLIAQMENNRKKVFKQGAVKANNLKIYPPQVRGGLSLAGQNILNNNSTVNSQYSSNQSKNAGVKPRKYKQNNITRFNSKSKNKFRTQTISHPSNSSEYESSIDKHTQKDSLSGFSHRDGKKQRLCTKDLDYFQRKTQKELMVISHGPQANKINDIAKDLASEIELFNGQGLFKKKKKDTNRNSINTNLTYEVSLSNRAESSVNIKRLQKFNTYNQESSLESIIQLSSIRKPPNALNDLLYEIQSIK